MIAVELSGEAGSFAFDVSCELPMRGVSALFGPSGCGKTTVLRCLAGLLRARGSLRVGDAVWQDDARGVFLPPHRRALGYVFQDASLFPHLSVRRNLVYGARRARSDDGGRAFAFDDVVSLLGLERLVERAPDALSGGERQRVAVGRALLAQPRLLLMDEPLSALDRASRDEILPYFETLHSELSVPIVYVSHDLAEVERLADTLVLLEAGRVLGCGALADLESDPSLPLLRAPEAAVTLDGRVVEVDAAWGLARIAVPGAELWLPADGAGGGAKRVRIRASDVSFARTRAADSTILNVLPARVVSVEGGDGDAQVHVVAALGEDGAGSQIVGRVTRKSREALGLEAGRAVFAQIKGVALLSSRA